MIGTTLDDIRSHIETLASDSGEYHLVCARYGDRPIPAAGLRFESRAIARAAARATEQYRAALRGYDPRVPCYDIIVCQEYDRQPHYDHFGGSDTCCSNDERWTLTEPVVTRSHRNTDRRRLVEFCHRIAAVVFEALSDGGYHGVETAIMDRYFELAEQLTDPDEFCLCLLESMAEALSQQLPPNEQAAVLARAAHRFDPSPEADEPVSAAFAELQEYGLVSRFTCSPWSAALDDWSRSVVVRCSGYALSPRDGCLPVLPITVDLFRHGLERPPTRTEVESIDDGWQLTLELGRGGEPNGLTRTPIPTEL